MLSLFSDASLFSSLFGSCVVGIIAWLLSLGSALGVLGSWPGGVMSGVLHTILPCVLGGTSFCGIIHLVFGIGSAVVELIPIVKGYLWLVSRLV